MSEKEEKKRADVPLPDNQEPRRHPLPTRTRSRRHTTTYTNIRIHICDNAHLRATHKELMFVGVPTINNNISFRFWNIFLFFRQERRPNAPKDATILISLSRINP